MLQFHDIIGGSKAIVFWGEVKLTKVIYVMYIDFVGQENVPLRTSILTCSKA